MWQVHKYVNCIRINSNHKNKWFLFILPEQQQQSSKKNKRKENNLFTYFNAVRKFKAVCVIYICMYYVLYNKIK